MGVQCLLCGVNSHVVLTEAPARTRISTSAARGSGCAKCGTTKKSGKRSCCAHGGDWFKNCGDDGDTKFGHTWAEGIQVCKGFGTSVLGKTTPLRLMFRHEAATVCSLDTTQVRNDTPGETSMCSPGGMLTAGNTDSTNCAGLTKFIECTIIILLLQSCLQCCWGSVYKLMHRS